jgi:hypothetical protein
MPANRQSANETRGVAGPGAGLRTAGRAQRWEKAFKTERRIKIKSGVTSHPPYRYRPLRTRYGAAFPALIIIDFEQA